MSIVSNPGRTGRSVVRKARSNMVKRVIFDACEFNFWIYLETFIPAFAKLWFTLTFLDLEDVLRDNAYRKLADRRGGSLRSMSHGRMGMRGGREPAVNRWSDRGLRTLLRVTEPLEKLGFVILCFFAVDRFFFEWSMLLDNRICNPMDRGSGFRASAGPGGDFPNPSCGAISLPEGQDAWGGANVSTFGGSLPNGHYWICLTVNYTGERPLTATPYRIKLRVPGNLGAGEFESEAVVIGAGRGGTLMVTADVNLPLLSGSTVSWCLEGPSVPTGLVRKEATVQAHQTS